MPIDHPLLQHRAHGGTFALRKRDEIRGQAMVPWIEEERQMAPGLMAGHQCRLLCPLGSKMVVSYAPPRLSHGFARGGCSSSCSGASGGPALPQSHVNPRRTSPYNWRRYDADVEPEVLDLRQAPGRAPGLLH